jgi:hypothetical protein
LHLVERYRQKYRFAITPNQNYKRRRLVPRKGALAIVTNAGRDAMDADVPLTNGM